ncbi:uncharacterized protein LOC106162871 isoform X2 [Lingula anatina]|uniref:Uncharacterized protein LOC106162871 isoform X2 n=1 Tax=Lingula anatina TaxID=7574 RepID=A0A1S3ID20_LINAN|nr:uncharacterized protein LOC106162871 isoform X2 [Lingula anatina]|eukprot:XP_013395756.1 uncharacterized protein LOC106162871 isoform X2 [Lingula anatina]
MPAFGTGAAKKDPQAVGKGMLEAIAEFVLQGGCTTLHRITIVLVQERLLDSFNMAECVPLQPQDPEYISISQSREFRGRQIERIERLPQPIPLQTFPVPRDVELAPEPYVTAFNQPRPRLRRPGGRHASFGFREEGGMSIPYLTESSREHRRITLASVLTGSMRGDDNVTSDDNVTEESQASSKKSTSKESTATVSSVSSLHGLSDPEIEGAGNQEEKNVAVALGDLSMFTSSDGKILVSSFTESTRSWYSVHLANENNRKKPQNN